MPSRSFAPIVELEKIPENLLREPTEFIYADHVRQCYLCTTLEEMLAERDDSALAERARTVLAYLQEHLPLHIVDEQSYLFPMLRLRCMPEDCIEPVIKLLSEEHSRDEALAAALVEALRRIVTGAHPTTGEDFARAAAAFAETQRRHLAWENAVVLPLARRRLDEADLTALGRAIAKRRGIPYPD